MGFDSRVIQRFTDLIKRGDDFVPSPSHRINIPTDKVAKFRGWSANVLTLLEYVFSKESIHYMEFSRNSEEFSRYETEISLACCKSILLAAKDDYESGYLFSIRSLIKAEDSVEILDQANDLLASKYKDPACILAGVALEIALKELSVQNNIPIQRMDAMNTELCKKGIYNMGMQKQVTAWAHWRNKAAHGEWNEYKPEDVEDMIKGVTRFIADYLTIK